VKNFIKQLYKKEMFNPGFFGLFVNPFYFARSGLYSNISDLIPSLKGRLLDVGCGSRPYEDLFLGDCYIGLELDSKETRAAANADHFYDGIKIPFDDDSFDSMLCNQVFEHVFNPKDFIVEVNRVLRKDALILISVPFVWDEHEQPFDYARYSSFGLRHILNNNGFEVVEYRKSNDGIEVIFQLLNAYLYKKLRFKNKYLRLFSRVVLISPFNILGWFFSKVFPRNQDLFLDSIVLAKKISNV